MKQLDVGRFYCTDSYCYQYCKEISPTKYQFTQINPYSLNYSKEFGYCVVTSEIDVSDMNIDDVKEAISGFYNSFAEMIEDYGEGCSVGTYLELIAECAFENECCEFHCTNGMSLEACIKYQHDWMLKNS